jgi:hypothetical protein
MRNVSSFTCYYGRKCWFSMAVLTYYIREKSKKYNIHETVALRVQKLNRTSKSKAIPVTGRGGTLGCETLRLPHFLGNRFTHGVEVVSLSAGCRLPPGRFLVLISIRGWVDPRATVWLDGLGKFNKSNYLIGNRTHDLPACSRGETNGWMRENIAIIAIFICTKYDKKKT